MHAVHFKIQQFPDPQPGGASSSASTASRFGERMSSAVSARSASAFKIPR
jgi:hypothetical protein